MRYFLDEFPNVSEGLFLGKARSKSWPAAAIINGILSESMGIRKKKFEGFLLLVQWLLFSLSRGFFGASSALESY